MPTEKEKAIVQIEKLRDNLPKEKEKELAQLLLFGEKYRKKGEKLKSEFWKEHNRDDFLNLISQYEESKQNFINGLPPEEKKILDNIKGIAKEKFYKEYLNEIILYIGNSENHSLKNGKKEILIKGEIDEIKTKIEKLKGKLKPGMAISLKYERIRDEGVKYLAEAWKNSLQPGMKIDLSYNQIGVEGVKYLAEAWKNSLQPGMKIDLNHNHIGDDGAKTIAKERKNSLQPGMEVSSRGNNIGDGGVQAIIDNNIELKDGVRLYLTDNHRLTFPKKAELRAWVKSKQEKGINCRVGV